MGEKEKPITAEERLEGVIIKNLAKKISDDVGFAMGRTISSASGVSRIPVAASGVMAALGAFSGVLRTQLLDQDLGMGNGDAILKVALVAANYAELDFANAYARAAADLAAIRAARATKKAEPDLLACLKTALALAETGDCFTDITSQYEIERWRAAIAVAEGRS